MSLRLSFIKDVTKETIPIILDEPFVYYDKKRLKLVLEFLNKEYQENQIIIFTCSNREINSLEELKMPYNVVEM